MLAWSFVGWGLYFIGSIAPEPVGSFTHVNMMALVMMSLPVIVLTTAIWLVMSAGVRITRAPYGTRSRTAGLCFLIGLAWLAPGTLAYWPIVGIAVEMAANV